MLNGSGEESLEFKNNIYNLYNLLEANTIPNQEKRVSFRSLKTHDNSKRQEILPHGTRNFKFEFLMNQPRNTKRFKCTFLKRDGSSYGLIELHACTVQEIEQHPVYLAQSSPAQKIIISGFNTINPNKASSIVGQKATGFKIHKDLYFVNNTTLISQFLIELLYQLRCKIFHGEIDPKPAYYDIYKYAYLIINPLIKTLN